MLNLYEEQIEALRADRDYWKAIATGGSDVKRDAELIHSRANIWATGAWLLARLYHANGDAVSIEKLLSAMPGYGDERTNGVVFVQIYRLRAVMPERDMIETVKQLGYRLSAKGIYWVQEILSTSS